MNFAPVVDRTYVAPPAKLLPATRNPGDASAPEAATPPPAAVNKADLQAAVDAANKFLTPIARNLQFSIDDNSGRTIVKVIDTETDKVVRQIPSEEMLAISRALGKLKGVMLEQKA